MWPLPIRLINIVSSALSSLRDILTIFLLPQPYPPHAGWWASKFLSKIISFFILFKTDFIDFSIVMTSLLPMGLYILITVTLTPSRRIVTAATYASYGLYAQFPGANNLLIMKHTLVVLFTSYRSEYSLG